MLRAAAGAVCEVDARRARLTLRVYRDGPLAVLGHDHVIAVQGLEGRVHRHAGPGRCALAVRFGVAALGVDEPALRVHFDVHTRPASLREGGHGS